MTNSDVAVLDFGSSKLTLLVGRKSVNNNFLISASSDIEYAGFMNGEFIEEDELKEKIEDAVKEVSLTLKQPIRKLYVGVPSEFSKVENITISKNYGKHTRISEKLIDKLFLDADKNIVSSTYSVINIAPIKYVLDSTNDTNDPVDCYCKTLDVDMCFVLADNRFTSLIGRILTDLKIKDVEYVSNILAEGQYLLSEGIRREGALLVDIGYLSTAIAYFKGDGIVEMTSISMGGAQITAELCEKMQIPFSVAEQVKQKLLISVKPTGIDSYEVYKGNKVEKIPALKANEISLNIIEELLNEIANAIEEFEKLPLDLTTLYLTGGGLSYLRGIEYYMTRLLGRQVKIVMPKQLKFKKPDLSSVIGLIDTSIKMEN